MHDRDARSRAASLAERDLIAGDDMAEAASARAIETAASCGSL